MRYARLVRKVVAIKCPKEEVDDVANEAWKKIQAAFPFDGIKNIEAYLTRVAQNEVKQFLRYRSAQKRPPPGGATALPEEQPSGANLDARFVNDPELSGKLDGKRLTENFLELGEELSGDNGELMERFLESPSSVSERDFKKLAASARKHVKRLGEDIDPLKEGPSFLGHLAKKLRKGKTEK